MRIIQEKTWKSIKHDDMKYINKKLKMNFKTSHKGHRKAITEEHTWLYVESLNLQLALNPIKEEVILLDEFSFSPRK